MGMILIIHCEISCRLLISYNSVHLSVVQQNTSPDAPKKRSRKSAPQRLVLNEVASRITDDSDQEIEMINDEELPSGNGSTGDVTRGTVVVIN